VTALSLRRLWTLYKRSVLTEGLRARGWWSGREDCAARAAHRSHLVRSGPYCCRNQFSAILSSAWPGVIRCPSHARTESPGLHPVSLTALVSPLRAALVFGCQAPPGQP
jgi:hypothetical protein